MAAEARAAIPASERAALIAFYNSTNGAGWCPRTGWRNATDTDFAPPGTECTWYGVTCDASGSHVTQLIFLYTCLSGSVPPEIGDLTNLGDLVLHDFDWRLNGSIPPEIGHLTELTRLSLAGGLTGSIPSEIGNLTNLRELDLDGTYGNDLAGSIPPEIGNLTRLTELRLGGNQLSGPIPPEIGNLTDLQALSLGHNQLTGPVPREIGNLRILGWLDLSENQLSGAIPPEIGQVGIFHRSENLLLRLDNNQLSGPIPPEIGNLIMGTTSPGTLRLDHNQLSGAIPREIGKLQWMDEFRLDHNQLSGSIPPEIGEVGMADGPFSTARLHLDHNHLSGLIPRDIAQLYSVRHLLLGSNQLAGPIPPQIGEMRLLEELDLSGNQLVGPIPAALMKLTRLVDGSSDLRWNALYTGDAALGDFLDSKQEGGDWQGTQTVAATGLAAGPPSSDSAPLRWTPILYIGDTGGYRSWYGTIPGGPYNLAGMTADKATGAFSVSGLSPGTTYYFALDTVTEPHANNQNTVVSERSAAVSATTTVGGLGWHGLTVVRYGPGKVSSSPEAIACGGACSATFPPGTPVTLTAAPDAGSTFLGWGGACAGGALTCDLTMDLEQTVTATFSPPATSFYTVAPCRVFDSRDAGLGGPIALAAGTDNAIVVGGYCGVPATARAVSLNVAVLGPTAAGHLRLFASGTPRSSTSSINYVSGQTRTNNAEVSLGADGALIVSVSQPSGTVHVVLDVSGYFQ